MGIEFMPTPIKYGPPPLEPIEIFWDLLRLLFVVLIPVLLIVGFIIYIKKKHKNKK